MKINLRSQIKKLSNRINLFSVLNEAVVNSIQAGATKITVEFFRDSEQSELLDDKPKINSVHISDNGEGFNRKNRESFSEYGTENKISEGCKGIGRLCYLKVFEDVWIESIIKTDSEKVECKFTENFQDSDFSIQKFQNIDSSQTTIKLHRAKINYAKRYGVSEIKETLFFHILPIMYLNLNLNIEIEIKDKTEENSSYIRTSDLPDFQQKDFNIREHVTNDKAEITFTLHYAIADSDDEKLHDYYCANKRTVCRFKDKELKIIPIKGKSAIFLVTSPFLDDAVNDERDDFNVFPKITNLLSPLSWEQINNRLKEALRDVIYGAYPNLQTENAKTIAAIRDENLHLADYMGEIDSLVGLIDSESIIEKAEQQFQQDKKSFRAVLKAETPNSEEVLRKASDLAGKELIEYVLTRDKIIAQFELLDLNKEKDEEIIRSHFLKRGLTGDSFSPVPVKENNLWLLDDKFMTYNYVASEKALKTLLSAVGLPKAESDDRFDIGIYSNSENGRRAIIVEFKKFSANYKENGEGINQLSTYADTLSKKGIDELYLYLVASVDEQFRSNLVNLYKFTKVFSQEGEIYHGTLSNVNAYIQIVSPKALIADARARNKTFIDMIRDLTIIKKGVV
jgi:Histidine kinase-, DNA gyrase B-, and HSP90-like ATPase